MNEEAPNKESGWSPEDSPIWRALLEHWKENDPERVRLLYQAGKLREALNDATDTALEAILKLKENGHTEEEAFFALVETWGAEADLESSNPLTDEELNELRRWLWKIAEED